MNTPQYPIEMITLFYAYTPLIGSGNNDDDHSNDETGKVSESFRSLTSPYPVVKHPMYHALGPHRLI